MKYLRSIISVLIAALFVGVAAPPVCPCGAPGDINGDDRTDVRDIQLLAAALSRPDLPRPEADVNGDGRVDVLDFQYVVAEAGEQAPPPPQPPAPEDKAACVPASGTVQTLSETGSAAPRAVHAAHGEIVRRDAHYAARHAHHATTAETNPAAQPVYPPPLRI